FVFACFSCCFFQAEDGIRDATVTGVQTCALPIFQRLHPSENWSAAQSTPATSSMTLTPQIFSRKFRVAWTNGCGWSKRIFRNGYDNLYACAKPPPTNNSVPVM